METVHETAERHAAEAGLPAEAAAVVAMAAPELAAAMAQVDITRAAAANTIRGLRELAAEILDTFAVKSGDGCSAYADQSQLAEWRKRAGRAAAMGESRGYREALQQVAKHHDDPIAQVRIIAKIARRALEGK